MFLVALSILTSILSTNSDTMNEPEATHLILFQVADGLSKKKSIVETAQRHFKKKELLIFFVEDDKAQSFVDELLWKMPECSFLPHIASDHITTEKIVITKTKSNLNKANFAFNLCSTPLLLPEFKLIYDFEDLSTPNKQRLASIRLNAYKEAGLIFEVVCV